MNTTEILTFAKVLEPIRNMDGFLEAEAYCKLKQEGLCELYSEDLIATIVQKINEWDNCSGDMLLFSERVNAVLTLSEFGTTRSDFNFLPNLSTKEVMNLLGRCDKEVFSHLLFCTAMLDREFYTDDFSLEYQKEAVVAIETAL